jgi:DNA-binding response OmpR family regulator
MMEAEIGRGRSLYKDQSVLILNQNSAPCAAEKCNSLLPLIKKSLPVKCIQEQSANRIVDSVSSAPDLILLRPAVGEAAQELIQSCKEKWPGASILVLLCATWDRLVDDLPSVLTQVDDFIPCPFHEGELLLRVRRLLQFKESKTTSSEKPDTNRRYTSVHSSGKARASCAQSRIFALWLSPTRLF